MRIIAMQPIAYNKKQYNPGDVIPCADEAIIAKWQKSNAVEIYKDGKQPKPAAPNPTLSPVPANIPPPEPTPELDPEPTPESTPEPTPPTPKKGKQGDTRANGN